MSARESPNEDLLWASYLGLRVLRTMCEHARLWGGAKTADRIIDEIEELRPDFVERRKQMLPAGGPP